MKITVANIPEKLKEDELKLMLTRFGQVAAIKFWREDGSGYIEMPVREQALRAIKALNGKRLYDQEITFAESTEQGRWQLD